MQKYYFLITSFFFCFTLLSQNGKVVAVKDGDTIVVLDSLNVQYTIRVADIDCPERGQPFSTKAKDFTSGEVFGKEVIIKKKDIDRYGRTIGFVLYEDKNLSLELLKNGLAGIILITPIIKKWHSSKLWPEKIRLVYGLMIIPSIHMIGGRNKKNSILIYGLI